MNSSKRACVEIAAKQLLLEIMEHVLSLLTVPELCRMRSVCKSWNEILARPSFHDLYDVNGRNKQEDELYLFVWSEVIRTRPIQGVIVNPLFSSTLSFLDVNARRWYSIRAADLPRLCACGHEVDSRLLAMNEGLICELTSVKDCTVKKFSLAIMDPVAKTRRILPAPPQIFVSHDQSRVIRSRIVTAVNDATRNYKVFLLNNLRLSAVRAEARVYVHDSFTDEWRALRNVPNGVDEENWALSAVVLHESLFVLKKKKISTLGFSYSLILFEYKFQEDIWADVYQMYFPRNLQHAQLAVSGNRLFLNVWLGGGRSSDPTLNPLGLDDPGLRSDPNCPHPVAIFRYPNWPETNTYFEMYEVLIAEYRRKPVVQLTDTQLTQIFERDSCELSVQYLAFPCVGSNGICSSVVLMHESRRFELRKYDLATGSVDVLPPHPLVDLSDASEFIEDYFTVKNMKLSLRNMLAQRSKVTSTGWKLLQ